LLFTSGMLADGRLARARYADGDGDDDKPQSG
jgi:hypothetical protein